MLLYPFSCPVAVGNRSIGIKKLIVINVLQKCICQLQGGRKDGGLLSAAFLSLVDREGNGMFTLRSNVLFPSLGKTRCFPVFFLPLFVREILGFLSEFFLVKYAKGNYLYSVFFPPLFMPVSPSSIQKPPCSLSLFLIVFSVFPRYSAIALISTSPTPPISRD